MDMELNSIFMDLLKSNLRDLQEVAKRTNLKGTSTLSYESVHHTLQEEILEKISTDFKVYRHYVELTETFSIGLLIG